MRKFTAADEEERLVALRSYEILDTPPEAVFDRITRLAARVFDVPIATMSLIDERRQWFKSCYGVASTETPREVAFCSHAILADDVLVISDARADARFAANPLVTGKPYIRFYAGAPLKTPGGLNLGTLCLVDSQPRDFSQADRDTLADLAAMLMDEMQFRQAAADIRRNEAKFRALTVNAQDIITIIARDGTIRFESPSVERVLGYAPEDLVGRNAFEFVHPDDAAATIERFGAALEGEVISTEFRFRHKDGSYRWLEAIGSQQSDEAVTGGLVVNSRDITHRRRREEWLRLLESVAVNARDAVLITEAEPVDLPGPRIIYVNDAFTKMTGYTAEEVIGQTPRILQSSRTDRAQLDKIRVALKAWQPVVVELVNCHKDGTEFWVELSIVPVADPSGWYTHWVSVQRDVSDRKETENVLRTAMEEAEQANRAKSDFLSRMSHELRTPLNAILGFAQLLESDAASEDDRESTEQILKAGRHLLGLINEVLDIARIEAGKTSISPEAVDLDEAVEEALDTIRPLAVARDVSLNGTTCGRFVRADRQRIKQVLLNLLSNAVKYNRRGGSVRIECEPVTGTLHGNVERLRLSMVDTGIGVSADGLTKLFTPFERLDAATSGVEGIGLGLTVCKRLITLMGGDIGVTSERGVGSTFWIELPVAENPSATLDVTAEANETENGTGRPTTILYIEDNLSNLRLVQRILTRRAEVKLIAAMNGDAGLALAEQHRPDLILLDLHLPDTGGPAVLERLLANEKTKQIPVVIVSADATPGQVKRLLTAGAKGYLTKPIEVGAFMRLIDETMAAHRA